MIKTLNRENRKTRAVTALFIESGSPASRANPRLVPSCWQPLNCKQTLGRGAVPTFFWGGETTRALAQSA